MIPLAYPQPILYPLLVLLGFVLVFAIPKTKHIQDPRLKRQYYILQFIMIVCAAVGAKLSVMWGDWNWPQTPMTWLQARDAGRSITGGLLLGFWGPELAKWIMKYPLPPNDTFAATLPFSLAIGRVGCLIDGCCRGAPWGGPFSIMYSDGIPRHPAQAYEILFHLIVGVSLLICLKKKLFFGRLFCMLLIAYGSFRFFSEFIRDTPKFVQGYSAYQVLALAILATGLGVLVKRSLYPPVEWQEYAPVKAV